MPRADILRLGVYARLMRLDRPVGNYLLLWPTLLALWIASQEFLARPPALKYWFVFIAGVFVTRALGCVINDIFDRRIDAEVARTKNRPLASGEASLREAIILAVALALIALGLVSLTNLFTILLAAAALLLMCLYPLSKRVIGAPQAVLGLVFSMGIPMAYTAQLQWIDASALLLMAGNFFWIIAYDTIYALQDRADDQRLGLGSSAILFGGRVRAGIAICQSLAGVCMTFYGVENFQNTPYYIGVLAMHGTFMYQFHLTGKPTPDYARAFRNNQYSGLILFAGAVINYFILL